MTNTQLLEQRLRSFLPARDDSDWEDVLRRVAAPTADSGSGRSVSAPHTRHWSRRLALSGVGALVAAGAVAAVLLVVFAGTGTPNAFAGWTATPTRPASGQTATALHDCSSRLAAASPGNPAADWQPLATDTRGPFTAMILKGDQATATCLTGPSFTTVGVNTTQGGGSQHLLSGTGPNSAVTSLLNPTAAGPITTAAEAQTSLDGQPYTLLQGQLESGVTGVTLGLTDGSQVQATVAGGSFVAWWPTNATAASAQASTSSSVTAQQLAFTAKSQLYTQTANGQAPNSLVRPSAHLKKLYSKNP
jgi:hypothetical protein